MRPRFRSIGPRMSCATTTPYDGHRRRLRWLEKTEALRLDVSLTRARLGVARALRLTPEQLRNIRAGKLKDLYGEARSRIDHAFVDAARREIADLDREVALALATDRPVDPGAVAKAKTSIDALEELIAEAEARSGARREQGP